MNFHSVITESSVHFQASSFKEVLAELALELNVAETRLLIDPDELDPDGFDNVRIDEDQDPVARIYTQDQYEKSRS